jgi:hypothetical protein
MRIRLALNERRGDDVKTVGATPEHRKGSYNICRLLEFECGGLQANRPARSLGLAYLTGGSLAFGVGHDSQSMKIRNKLAQYFDTLASKIHALNREAGGVAAWPGQTRN